MKPIYEPKGKAKEYGDYALNIYTGCPHDIQHVPTLTPPNEWVSVEDRLPTKSGEYFAYTTDENINIIEFDEDYGEFGFRKEYYQDGAYLDSEWVKADWITHWMPLPTPPDSRPLVGEANA